jgi:ATP-dependent DNA ligase
VWAFDLLERDGEDLRDLPLERRKDELKVLLKRTLFGLALNDYVAGDGPALFAQVCAMGPRGIVSKRRASPYRSGRSSHWLKAKNAIVLATLQSQALQAAKGNNQLSGECLFEFRPSLSSRASKSLASLRPGSSCARATG